VIAGFDHVVIAVRDCAAGVSAYEALLGRRAGPIETRDGVAAALIATDNIAVELMAPAGESDGARRLSAALEDGGEGLKSLVFAVDDIERMHRRCGRLGLNPEPIGFGPPASSRQATLQSSQCGGPPVVASRPEAGGPLWRSFRANTERTHGVRLFFMRRAAPLTPAPAQAGGVTGLDHIVVRTPDPERAAALYGARLGLDMRLDRDVRGRRLMFFRCGDAIVEIAHAPERSHDRDDLWGLSWRVADADAARERLAGAGLDVSEVRAGVKPGTRVFTVRDRTCGVPTLMIEPTQR
jgi:catechol 2,3-dioxygenase-like lactoylglutathione lyase family enzyme